MQKRTFSTEKSWYDTAKSYLGGEPEKPEKKALPEPPKSKVWYFIGVVLRVLRSSFNMLRSLFGGSQAKSSSSWFPSFPTFYNPLNAVRDTKNFVLKKVVKIFGGIFFIYFLAK